MILVGMRPVTTYALLTFISFVSSRFVETDGKGFDRVRGYEIGKKHFKLTHFEEVLRCYSLFQLATVDFPSI
jgi:hypothetical protein